VTVTVYEWELSANCYKVRLLLSLLGIEYESVPIDFYPGREHEGAEFRAINPMGHIPVLDDNGYVIRDAHAILVYLSTKYDRTGHWYPTGDAARLGECASWMAFADATAGSASAARLHVNLGYDFDLEARQADAHRLFRVLDEHLWFREREGQDWLVAGAQPTLADIAVFPDVMLSEEGGISRLDYPAIRRWTDRVKTIPGFVVMPGVFPVGTS